MSAFTQAAPQGGGMLLSLRLAVRELRAGLGGFVVFIACIALGVMAIAGVGLFARSLSDGLAREGRTILGGDLAFSLIARETNADERAFLQGRGKISAAATMRAMARTDDGGAALIELKAVDSAYPLFGQVVMEPAADLAATFALRDGAYGAAADAALLARLGLSLGARVTVGTTPIEIRAVLRTEPDKLAAGVGFGPRLLVGEPALRATGLLAPGSLVRWMYRVQLPPGGDSDRDADKMAADALVQLPDAGWEVRSRSNASPQLERNIERFTQFLTLVGLIALLVGGVGVANAVKSYLERKREAIATLKALGATGGRVFAVYLLQVLVLAGIGTAIGLAAGVALPFGVAAAFGSVLPLPIEPTVHAGELVLAGAYGLLTALAFALWPLGRAHDVPVSALFRDAVAPQRSWPRLRYVVATLAVVATLIGLAVVSAHDRRIALVFVAAAAVTFLALRLIALLVMALARRLPHARVMALRLAITNIHRPGALTPTVVLSLGLGLALLVTVTMIDGNLRRQFTAGLPERAPSFFFLDIQQNDTARFAALIKSAAPGAKLDTVPMLRGRISVVNGVRAEDVKVSAQAAWALQGDRGITYGAAVPEGSRLVAGEAWPADYAGPPLVSLEKRIADGLGLNVGDSLTVNVLGRNITARIAALRRVDWQSLGINFVLVYSPTTFAGAPHTSIATLTDPDAGDPARDAAIVKTVSAALPAVTAVSVKDALDAVAGLVGNLVTAIRGASLLCILSAVLVLGGALAASHRHRVYEAVVLKTLGATRARLLTAYALEYLLLGAVTAVFGVAAGSVAAWFIVTDIMNLGFVWLPGPAAAAAIGALLLTVVFGLLGTLSALGQKPASVLRNL